MKIDKVELLHVRMPLVKPFRTSFGETSTKDSILVKTYSDGLAGFGETAPFSGPFYSYETIDTAWGVLRDYIVPVILKEQIEGPEELTRLLRPIRGHPFAKAGIEIALWDLVSQREGVPLNKLLGGTREKVAVGISLGIEDKVGLLLDGIEESLAKGYQRIKIKIEPGWDVDVVADVRRRFGDIPLQVDANSAYSLADIETFRRLDDFNLLMVEQPLAHDDLFDHAELQRQISTPICLDESVHSVETARRALQLGSCRIINIKPARVGGLHSARAIHDLCQENGVPVWCGGMLESGIGQCINIEISALPNYSLANDLEPSRRFFAEDLIEPDLTMDSDGTFPVPTKPRSLHVPNEKAIAKYTVDRIAMD
jgi:O-succinylbenzoate synthase